jgi:hypothetical protein
MSAFDELMHLQVEDAAGVRGVGEAGSCRLTRRADGATVLLHKLTPAAAVALSGATFDSQLADFNRPFLTKFAGLLADHGSVFLVEPLPPAVPLRSVWAEVLRTKPQWAAAALGQLVGQLQEVLAPLRAVGRGHGAVCVDNVVLTTVGVYGLLQARLQTPAGQVWLRPAPSPPENRAALGTTPTPDEPESIRPVVAELIAMAERAKCSLSFGGRYLDDHLLDALNGSPSR